MTRVWVNRCQDGGIIGDCIRHAQRFGKVGGARLFLIAVMSGFAATSSPSHRSCAASPAQACATLRCRHLAMPERIITVVFKDLAPDTMYAYRVGTRGSWSEWNQFLTARRDPESFSFISFGDPQEEIRSKCSRIFRAAYKKAPDADFWHFVGDLVDNGDRD